MNRHINVVRMRLSSSPWQLRRLSGIDDLPGAKMPSPAVPGPLRGIAPGQETEQTLESARLIAMEAIARAKLSAMKRPTGPV